jgi:hypothetical protein
MLMVKFTEMYKPNRDKEKNAEIEESPQKSDKLWEDMAIHLESI